MSSVADYTKYPTTKLSDLKHIPGKTGLPVLGMGPALFTDFFGTIQKHQQQFGDVSKFGLPLQTGVALFGPDHAQTVLQDREQLFSNHMGYSHVLQSWFGNSILSRDFAEHRTHRRLFQAAFKTNAMRAYGEGINQIIERYLSGLSGQDEVTFTPFIKNILINIGAEIFYGIDNMGEQSEQFSKAFLLILEKGMQSIVHKDIPPFNFHKGMKGKKFVVEYLGSLIEARRNGDGVDFMTYLTKEKRDDGLYFSNQDLIDHLSFLFFAAFDTTSTGLSHLVMHLAADQDLQDRLRAQSLESGLSKIGFDDVANFTEIEMAFNESLRLYPPVPIIMRRTIRDTVFDSIPVPANTLVFLVPGFNHRMPEYWSQPEVFDIDRFSLERAEHKQHPYQFIPFGGGAHKCLGMNFAFMNAKLFMHQFLLKYRFKLKPGYEVGTRILPTPTPNEQLPIILEKLAS